MAEPSDMDLYNKSKEEVNKNYDKPSAYRSMAYTRTYLKNYREKYGNDKKAYKGKNPENLKTWRKEKWVDVKSVLKDPKNPTACGNAPIKKGEYPLCMPEKQLAKYSESELSLLVQRKNQIGKRRLVKDAFLRDILEPEKITPIREYKDKYVKDKKAKLPEPLPKEQADKILKEKPVKVKVVVDKPAKKTKTEPTEQELEDKREAKNKRQREAYVSVKKPKTTKADIVSEAQPEKKKEDKIPVAKTKRTFRPTGIEIQRGDFIPDFS
jgi:hypothetical protein